mmetsp:Transcript_52077/g.108411  ORF Transcript_52077/g.108411 Transcript_52077/m.108411 type:complete len:81 (+) Transcript_52077:561-803(+)
MPGTTPPTMLPIGQAALIWMTPGAAEGKTWMRAGATLAVVATQAVILDTGPAEDGVGMAGTGTEMRSYGLLLWRCAGVLA